MESRNETGAGGSTDIVSRHRNLGRRAILVTTLTGFSRLLGYGRDLMMAAIFGGSSPVLDAFFTGWRIPNLFRRFLGEGALGMAFQRTLTNTEARDGLGAGRQLFRAIIKLLVPALFLICGALMLGIWYLPDRIPGLGWAWLGKDPQFVRELSVRCMPYLIVVCLTALAAAALNVRGRFTASTWTAPIMNLVWIGALVAVGLTYGWSGAVESERQMDMARMLAWGVLLAGAAQLLVVTWPLYQEGFLGRGAAAGAGKGAAGGNKQDLTGISAARNRVLRDTLPMALAAAAYQVNMLVDGLMAESLLSDGGPSAQFFANRFHQFPLALGAFSVMSAVYPALQALVAKGGRTAARQLHDRAQMTALFIGLPASFGMFFLAEPLVGLLERGRFDVGEVARTAGALQALCLAIVPAGACTIALRAHHAFGGTAFVAAVSCGQTVVNILANIGFVVGLGMDVEGLALGSALASWISLIVLMTSLRRRYGEVGGLTNLGRRIAIMASGGLGAGVLGAWVHGLLVTSVGNTLALISGALAGAGLYFVVAAATRQPELAETLEKIRRRLR
ncbi:MAG: lipid II flippase MurJ [Planctomycetota bacterium]|jgi:putative peptidoglycan lipid II flippase|nr:hypothetical protein [Planctomycetota bacterium]MDP6368274.1 lipid II flippase MurJ [Planctomycetota bacterium]MDP6520316.1 lipid II flippase MurJ [Planctomycetota bacterium]MDP6837460.1 lipid II flippase MurJ [Planctomycetota bacterium]MDP6955362.1 lipid II flippase MurJ [Planctomycetota bacterium]